MDNKYYTPKIEEFHVGFECEIKDIPPPEEDWHQHTISEYDQFELLEEWLEEKSIRVKWLDIEDCESLGWEPSTDEPEEWFWRHKNNLDAQLYYDDKIKYTQGPFPDIGPIGITIYTETAIPAFVGWVKNKSELKRLMEQLGI